MTDFRISAKHSGGFFPVLFIMIFLFSPGVIFSVDNVKLENQYLAVNFENLNGRFAVQITKGDPQVPSDDGLRLTGDALSSFMIIRIDDSFVKFGDSSGKMSKPVIRSDGVTFTWIRGNVEFEEDVQLVSTPVSPIPLGLRIKFWVRNKDTKQHMIGLRYIMDTFLGTEDSNPFIIPGIGAISKEMVLKNANVPDCLYSWDSLTAPSGRAYMGFTGGDVVKPDVIEFACRSRLALVNWDFKADGVKDFRDSSGLFDSGCGLQWNPVRFKPGKENGIAFHFGLAEINAAPAIPPLEFGTFGPISTTATDFWLSTEAANGDPSHSIKDLKIRIELGDGLLAPGTDQANLISELAPLEKRFLFWRVHATKTGTFPYKISASGVCNSSPVVNQTKGQIGIK
jgi:hypothetical protein